VDYKQTFQIILIINFLLLLLLAAISWRFLSGQLEKTKQIEPEIMAQYEVVLEVGQFSDLIRQLKKLE